MAWFGLLVTNAAPAAGQLISPGRLANPHAQLEGIRQCTQCHQLGQKGASTALCLACHQPLADRIRAGTGYHATVSTECATCHKEHFGREFALIRFDTASFDHGKATGYQLEGDHSSAACRDCHTPTRIPDPAVRRAETTQGALSRTFLGLPTECASCHRDDDPHEGEFAGRACSSCHDTRDWKVAAGFDHAAARYPLTGRHAQVECAACHRVDPSSGGAQHPVVFAPLEFGACTSCHRDEHQGAMPGRCESCHSTAGWTRVDRTAIESRFNHRTTGFQLVGRHAELACASCHTSRTAAGLPGIHMTYVAGTARRPYPTPVTGSCLSCHVDAHRGELNVSDCVSCHGQETWLPASFDLERHDREASFHLEGAHRTVACAECHRSASDSLVLRPPSGTCATCHATDDPHAGQFADRACESCHTTASFRITGFDHTTTRFALDGSHRDVPCASCHKTEVDPGGVAVVRYLPLGSQCRSCHEEER